METILTLPRAIMKSKLMNVRHLCFVHKTLPILSFPAGEETAFGNVFYVLYEIVFRRSFIIRVPVSNSTLNVFYQK